MKTPIEIKPSPCPSQAARRLACKILRPYVAPLSSSPRTDVKTQLAYLVDMLDHSWSIILLFGLHTPLKISKQSNVFNVGSPKTFLVSACIHILNGCIALICRVLN